MNDLYIGLMSGTSMDAVDAVLIDLSMNPPKLLATHTEKIANEFKQQLLSLCLPGENEINRMGILDRQVGELFAKTANNLLGQTSIKAKQVTAIGSHGQAIRHHPDLPIGFTLQIGDPNTVAERTRITTVADFRRRDIVKGGQGAPLTPAFHEYLFRSNQHNRLVLNLGGIANITWLPADTEQAIIGFDTGPANTLLDAWTYQHLQQPYDAEGAWASSGKIIPVLLDRLMSDPYFHKTPPKSTGREHFNLAWLKNHLAVLQKEFTPPDIQATLCELTALSIAQSIHQLSQTPCQILLCGGGIQNTFLLKRLQAHCPQHNLHSSEEFGIAPQWLEAAAFAWFAKQTLAGKPANMPSVTGADGYTILGGVYYA